ncbi:MAG: GlsB/YeaQ/YmgE family stress response membrane protein [Pseudomonadota bacterium]
MNFVVWLVVGGTIGWIAAIAMGTTSRRDATMNVAVGVVGALLGGWVISPLIGGAAINDSDFSFVSMLTSFIGAMMVLAIANFLRHVPAKSGSS